jgi:hypothetical protein
MLAGTSVPVWLAGEVPVYTAKGTRIPNERPLPKAPVAMKESHRIIHEQHPRAKLRSLGSTYNCAGLVLAFRRTFIDDFSSVLTYLAEDGYRPLKSDEQASAGDVVAYKSDADALEHLGIILEAPTTGLEAAAGPLIMSKWGHFGEYIHRLMDKPGSLGSKIQIWTERV